jgi:hypothetical protein
MLFVDTKILSYQLSGLDRLHLLERLRQQGKTPLIRASRLNFFGNLLSGHEQVKQLEERMAQKVESEDSDPYLPGDIFCLNDNVFFIVFEARQQELLGIQAGVIYDSQSSEPLRKLDVFCRELSALLPLATDDEGSDRTVRVWLHGSSVMPEGFKRFVANQDNDSMYTSLRKGTMAKRILASSRLEDSRAREFLRSTREAHIVGYANKLLTGDTTGAYEFSIETLQEAGLVEREVQVRCRKTGHSLLRLPNAHALVVVTVSDATCSECGAPVADERVEEVIAPTELASSLLEDGAWLVNRLHFLLREMGVRESEIALGPSVGEGYGQLMANICGEPFLLVARDGDLTTAFARWAVDLEIETEASHLVVVSTGTVHNQARGLLHNHARRRVMAGRDFELVIADGPAAARAELSTAFTRVSHRVIAEHLCDLDRTVGLNVTDLIMTRFDLFRSSNDAEPRHLFSEEPAPQPSQSITRPLALAAGASTDMPGTIDVEVVSDDLRLSSDAPPGHDTEVEIISDARASWE